MEYGLVAYYGRQGCGILKDLNNLKDGGEKLWKSQKFVTNW